MLIKGFQSYAIQKPKDNQHHLETNSKRAWHCGSSREYGDFAKNILRIRRILTPRRLFLVKSSLLLKYLHYLFIFNI